MTRVTVTVAYALADRATLIEVRLPAGATVADAIRYSGICDRHPELGHGRLAVGIYGKRVERTAALADGDRVELYRSLLADPKAARRRRAKALRAR